jgi:uncharacterized protein (DUF1778 family)
MATKIKGVKGSFYRMDAYFTDLPTTKLIEKAAKIDGRKVSQYIAKAAEDAAKKTIARYQERAAIAAERQFREHPHV